MTRPRFDTAKVLRGIPHGFTDSDKGSGADAGGARQGPGGVGQPPKGPQAVSDQVTQNRRGFLAALGCAERHWAGLHQVHGARIVRATAAEGAHHLPVDGQTLQIEAGGIGQPAHCPADAMWTCDPKLVLAILVADCVPILLAASSGSQVVVAAVHAGWRGTTAGIGRRTVEVLQNAAGVAPQTLSAALGPAIGPCCFSVGEAVAAQLRAAYPQAPPAAWQPNGIKTRVDLWALNAHGLVLAGVPRERIDILRHCTACTSRFFSYRRQGAAAGRQVALIGLPNPASTMSCIS